MIKRRTFLGACLAGGLAAVLTYILRSTKLLNKPATKPNLTSYSAGTIDTHIVSQLLWAAQGITLHPFRSAPSAGGIYPLEVYVVVGPDVDGIEEGAYHYFPEGHTLDPILKGDRRKQLAQAFNNITSHFIEKSPVSLIITAVYERTMNKYGTRGIQYVHLEIGHVVQNVLLQATSLGLTATCLPVFSEPVIKYLLNTPEPLLIIPTSEQSQNDRIRALETTIPPEEFITLPTVDLAGTMTVEETIARRRSIRMYSSDALPLEKFSKILWAAQGARNPETNELAFPSISGTHPVEIYMIVSRVKGLVGGVYRYFSANHSLELIRQGDFVNELAVAGLEQPWIQEAPANFVISANYQKVREKFGELGERITHFEVGQVAENIYLEAQALELGTVVIGAFHDSMVREIVNLPRDQSPLYIMPLGLRTD